MFCIGVGVGGCVGVDGRVGVVYRCSVGVGVGGCVGVDGRVGVGVV